MLCYLVRHAESAFNAEGRIQGQLDAPLSPLGVRQAAALAEALASEPIQAIYTSPLRRAYETARPIAERLGLPLQTDPRLMEINAGVLQGLRYEEMVEQYPDLAARWAAGDPDFVIPQGESRRQLMTRGKAALEEILGRGQSPTVVVAHGGLLAAALKGLLEIPAERNPFRFYNASISQLAVESQLKLLSLNRVDHLRSVDEAPESHAAEL